jgi:imidazolonepropionase
LGGKEYNLNGNLIIKNAFQIVTCSGFAPKTGSDMNKLDIIEDGAVVIEKGMITAVGPTEKMSEKMSETEADGFETFDARGKAVLPGFVDSHTHFVFSGFREEEFGWRLRGDSYMDIMERGGGILSTVKATIKASKEDLIHSGVSRLNTMLSYGVTTVEGKSGYGLDRDTELKQLEVMDYLNKTHFMDIVPTFLGAHAVPKEYRGKEDQFIEYLMEAVLPGVAKKQLAKFCDVFCEKGVFSVEQSRRLLARAKALGLKVKLHADEMNPFGGAELASELGAVSADHLLCASQSGIREMVETGVVATLLPATAFCLKESYADGRSMIDSGCAVALATDFNPGSSFTCSIPLILALASLYMGMTPEEAVTAVTLNGAAALGMADTIGSIDVGKQADLVILEYPSYLFLSYHTGVNIVEKVIKNGNLVYDKQRGGILY